MTDWADETIAEGGTIRHEYIEAIRAADQGDLEPLMGLHRRYSLP